MDKVEVADFLTWLNRLGLNLNFNSTMAEELYINFKDLTLDESKDTVRQLLREEGNKPFSFKNLFFRLSLTQKQKRHQERQRALADIGTNKPVSQEDRERIKNMIDYAIENIKSRSKTYGDISS